MRKTLNFANEGPPSIPGSDYVVCYKDNHTGLEKMAGAEWINGEFHYCSQQFVTPSMTPSMTPTWEQKSGRHLILGWSKLSDYREQEEK